MKRFIKESVLSHCRYELDDYEQWFKSNGGDTWECDGQTLYYLDRGSSVLSVAHTDFVLWNEPKAKRGRITAPQLDDRAGCAIACDILPAMGIDCDILLTVDEEIGKSSAQWSQGIIRDDYNWMVEFDRAGCDVVTYQYSDQYWEDSLNEFASLGWGSFSDICELEHLGVCGVNWGTGYHRQHTKECYLNVAECHHMLELFRSFYGVYKKTLFPWQPAKDFGWDSSPVNPSNWYDDDDEDEEDWLHCVTCGQPNMVDPIDGHCMYCGVMNDKRYYTDNLNWA